MTRVKVLACLALAPLAAAAAAVAASANAAPRRVQEAPTAGEQNSCDASTPCPQGTYCGHSSGRDGGDDGDGGGYCVECPSADVDGGGGPYPSSCVYGDTEMGREACVYSCFPDHVCSADAPCPDAGQFCTFQLGPTGLCTSCAALVHPADCGVWDMPPAGRAECESRCFDPCSDDVPCPDDGAFCSGGPAGLCIDCSAVLGDPSLCSSPYYPYNFTASGQRECLSRCFEPCAAGEEDGGCSSGETFCNLIDGPQGGANGYCQACRHHDPEWCFGITQDSTSSENCASSCFGECSSLECADNSFCALRADGTDAGYCMSCDDVPDVLSCFDRNTNDVGKELCASTCFGKCSTDDSCPAGSFCDFLLGEEEGGGYCYDCSPLLSYDGPLNCMAFDPPAQESCVTSCFGACSADVPCPPIVDYDHKYCDFQLGSSGACATCPSIDDDDSPCDNIQTWDGKTLSEAGVEACNSTCFRPCDPNDLSASSCPPEHICTFEGYCRPDYEYTEPSGAAFIGPSLHFLGAILPIYVVALFP